MKKIRSFLEIFKLIFKTLFIIIVVIPSVLLLKRNEAWKDCEILLKDYIKNHIIRSRKLINKKGYTKWKKLPVIMK